MNTTAYVVTTGEYSDYHIEAVFLDEDAAKTYEKNYNKVHGNDFEVCGIEEFEVKESGGRVVPHLSCRLHIPEQSWDGEEEGFIFEEDAEPITTAYSGGPLYPYVTVAGCDFDRVRKAFQDRVAKMKAEIEGI